MPSEKETPDESPKLRHLCTPQQLDKDGRLWKSCQLTPIMSQGSGTFSNPSSPFVESDLDLPLRKGKRSCTTNHPMFHFVSSQAPLSVFSGSGFANSLALIPVASASSSCSSLLVCGFYFPLCFRLEIVPFLLDSSYSLIGQSA